MITFKQITKNEWKRGDFKAFASINKTTEELLGKFDIDFENHYIEGLGKAKIALFVTSNNNQFLITEYLEPIIPITEIFILDNPILLKDIFKEVLEVLNLDYSNLDWTNESVTN